MACAVGCAEEIPGVGIVGIDLGDVLESVDRGCRAISEFL